jgi:hypothetical protein
MTSILIVSLIDGASGGANPPAPPPPPPAHVNATARLVLG